MDYSFLLCFDKETESRFNKLIESIAEIRAGSYAGDAKVPPHISVACFRSDNIEPIVKELERNITSFKAADIVWPSIGMFVPHVLFAAPVLNEYLLNVCTTINRLIEPFSTVGERGMYLPFNWVPHTTLAPQLSDDELQNAIGIAAKQFSYGIAGKANRLMLIEYNCSPYKEIKTWELI